MTTVADVLVLFENLLNGDWKTKREAQRCLRDICEEHGCESLRALISGHYFTCSIVSEYSEDTFGLFRTNDEAKIAGDREAIEMLFTEPVDTKKLLAEKKPGYWLARYNHERRRSGRYIEIDFATMLEVPVWFDEGENPSDFASDIGVIMPNEEDR